MKNISRRRFLGEASCAAIGASTLFSSIFNMGLVNAAAAANAPVYTNDNYKALVCILLAGGNDSFNMLVPRGNAEYNEYEAVRSNLALSQGSLLPLNGTTSNGKTLGLHPSMPEVQSLFNNNKLSFISNVGTLIEPITKSQYLSGSIPVPLGLFSHADQIQQWQTSLPNSRSAIGWGGRMADILQSLNGNQNISMNISLSGTNTFQSGNDVVEYSITPDGSIGINGHGTFPELTTAVNSLLDAQYADIYRQTYASTARTARDSHELFSTAIDGIAPLTTTFANDSFGLGISRNLEMVAKTIAARDTLNVCRQTFFILVGGWDHHAEVLGTQAAMLTEVSRALNEFNSAMEELGVQDDVTTFTISDFGRTLTSNGNGSDHAWGGNVLVMGGSVNGGNIYGDYPDLALGSNLEIDSGVLIPTLSCDEYFAELALWFGAASGDLAEILPNIGNFYNTGSGVNPIGFMG